MPAKLNLPGLIFGRLTVLSEDGRDKHGAVMWKCRCECGSESSVRGSQLKSGVSASCGCTIGGVVTHGMSGTSIYLRWRAMLDRTTNPNHSAYHNYGGRGIAVCEEWMSFEQFHADMGPTFEENLDLDRRDTNGNYEPANCRWVSHSVQQRNRRTNHRIMWKGRTLSLVEWQELLGVKANTILTRLRRGWTVERALTAGVSQAVLLEIANS